MPTDHETVFAEFFDKALKFLSYRPRSEQETARYLLKKGISQPLLEKILDRLKQLEFIDDRAFCRWWIEQRSRVNPKGARAVKAELREKGIPEEIIDRELAENRSETSDFQLAEKIIRKKLAKFAGLADLEIKNKLYSTLVQKGFDYEIIRKAVDNALKKE